MYTRDAGRVHNRLIKQLDRHRRQSAYQEGRFFRFKLPEIHNRLWQALLEEKIIETDNAAAVSDSILKGLKKALHSSEFDFEYFISPIRSLVPHPNPYSLFMTQYLMEVLIDDPSVIEIYGTDEEVYHVINRVISQSHIHFDQVEEEIVAQLAQKKTMLPGSPEYQIALEQLLRERIGEPEK